MEKRSVSTVCLAIICMLFAPLTSAQPSWQEAPMRGAPKARAIAIPAEAEYKGKTIKAYLFISGYDGRAGGSNYPLLGIYVEKVESILPASEINQFVGPDYSMVALDSDAINISLEKKGRRESISTRLVYEQARFFDTGFLEDGYFETNPRKTKAATEAWRHFLLDMSDGFDEGKAVIGGKAFSSELTVKFSGNGIGPNLKALLSFCKE